MLLMIQRVAEFVSGRRRALKTMTGAAVPASAKSYQAKPLCVRSVFYKPFFYLSNSCCGAQAKFSNQARTQCFGSVVVT